MQNVILLAMLFLSILLAASAVPIGSKEETPSSLAAEDEGTIKKRFDPRAYPMTFGKRRISGGLDPNAFRMNFGKRFSPLVDRPIYQFDGLFDYGEKRFDAHHFNIGFGRR